MSDGNKQDNTGGKVGPETIDKPKESKEKALFEPSSSREPNDIRMDVFFPGSGENGEKIAVKEGSDYTEHQDRDHS